jgi:methionyl-tRNA formyltransferase
MRTVLICHDGARLDQVGLANWLASFSHLAGVIVLREPRRRLWQRVKHECRRSGIARLADVLAFRAYYRLWLAPRDRAWENAELDRLAQLYPPPAASPRICVTSSPNSPEVRAFLNELAPDLVIARCKTLLKPSTFSIPRWGTFVLHPGKCPEYRDAHGCFWALANHQPEHVAVTLLRIDDGVDTGPVFGYYSCEFDSARDSHVVIQAKAVTSNLDAIRGKLEEIDAGTAVPLDTRGRASAVWGQPWLTKYFSWKRAARREAHASCQPALS